MEFPKESAFAQENERQQQFLVEATEQTEGEKKVITAKVARGVVPVPIDDLYQLENLLLGGEAEEALEWVRRRL